MTLTSVMERAAEAAAMASSPLRPCCSFACHYCLGFIPSRGDRGIYVSEWWKRWVV